MIPVMIPVVILRATHPLHHEGVHTAPSTIVGPMVVATTTFGDVTMVWQHLGMDSDMWIIPGDSASLSVEFC